MTFVTHPDHATLQRLHEGGLDAAEASATRTHLESCESCRARSSRIALLFAGLATPPALPQPPVDFMARVMASVEREGLARAPERRLRAALTAIAAGSGAAAAGGALILGGGASAPASGLVSALTDVIAHGDIAATVFRAAAPVLGAAALSTLAILVPVVVKTMQTLQPRPATVRVRAR